MDFLTLVFRLGVVFAIFSFIWFLIQLGIMLLQTGRIVPYPVRLILKAIQYLLLADVVVIFCYAGGNPLLENLLISGLILLLYFVGKMRAGQQRLVMVQVRSSFSSPTTEKTDLRWESLPIALGMASYLLFAMRPVFAENPAANWFYSSIVDIEKTSVIGLIFKVVGFFFSLAILLRLISAFSWILSGEAFRKQTSNEHGRKDDDFDDYEEVK